MWQDLCSFYCSIICFYSFTKVLFRLNNNVNEQTKKRTTDQKEFKYYYCGLNRSAISET